MSEGYHLTLRADQHWSDASMLLPEILGGLAMEQLEQKLGKAFAITGQAGETLELHGFPGLHGLGAHMTRGRLVIHGDAGDDLGAAMTGGTIMVHGHAGDRVGGPGVAGSRQGMNGGVILIDANAGDEAGLRMRRGLIVIQGKAGVSPGYRMIAGTVVVGQGDLHQPGLEMQRGTIVSLCPWAAMHTGEGFAVDNTCASPAMAIIGLLLAQLQSLGVSLTDAMRQGHWRLSSGDRFELGKGEIWQWIH